MANLKYSFNYSKDNEYYTTKKAWENIQHLIPKNKIIWEMCMLNRKNNSMKYLKELGYNVVGNTKWDCLKTKPDNFDIVITNPPFETKIKKKILNRLIEMDKPFIIILNSMNIYSIYMRNIFGDKLKDLQIIIPKKKIMFEKKKILPESSFYSCYLAYKLNLKNEDLWLI